VDIQLTGTFAQVVEYLKELRNFPRLIIVDSVALTPQTLPKLGVTIRAEIYTLGTGETGGTH
jgi:Tfp pilus assembly protein PilO